MTIYGSRTLNFNNPWNIFKVIKIIELVILKWSNDKLHY